MPVGATIGASVITAGAGIYGANKAASAERAGADKASATQLEMYNKTRGDLSPYNETGKAATYTLAGLYGLPGADGTVHAPDYSGFKNSPDYAFAKEQGINALDSSAAAKGNLLSGGMVKELADYGSGLASQNYGNYVQRLMGLAQLGESAGSQTGSLGANAAGNIGNAQMRAGEATASGFVGATNSLNRGIDNSLSAYNQSRGMAGPQAIGAPQDIRPAGVYGA